MRRNRRSLLDLVPGAGLALAAAVLFAPAARADCTTALPNLSGPSLPFASPSSASHAAPVHPPGSGRHCGPHDPVLPGAAAPPSGGVDWGCASAFVPFTTSPFGRSRPDDAPGRPVRRAAFIFHPPRQSPPLI